MPLTQVHKEFFHAVSHLEPMVSLWSEDPHFNDRSLANMFHYDLPTTMAGKDLTFGEFIDKIDQLAGQHGGSVLSPQGNVRNVKVDSAAIYAMSLHIVDRARCHCHNLAEMEQMVPLVNQLVGLVESLIDVKHGEPRIPHNFERDFLRNANMGFVRRKGRVDLFDEVKAIAMAEKAEEAIKPLFASLPGAFQDQMTFIALVLEGSQHGFQQAADLKRFEQEQAGPGL
jgi:hypothetical protein